MMAAMLAGWNSALTPSSSCSFSPRFARFITYSSVVEYLTICSIYLLYRVFIVTVTHHHMAGINAVRLNDIGYDQEEF